MTMTQWWAPTTVRISGDSSVRGQLLKTTDGSLYCDFPERMILIANHQIYTDWLYLWWIGYTAGMHGRIYVVLKESLKRIPVIGWGMQFSQFIFLKRKWEQDKPRMAAHLQKFNNRKDPMWLMMFPEGTNLADSTREASRQWAEKNGIKDMQHTLLPRSTGLQFILQELRHTVDYVYDCTIAYEGVPRGQFAQDIFTVGASYFGGRPPKSVNMYWRRFLISSIPLDDPKQFELWLRERWREKDKFIEDYYRTGRLPADEGVSKDEKGQLIRGSGHIEAQIRPKYWYEFLQVFAPIGLFALVLYMFYGALPTKVLNQIKSIDQATVLKQIDAYQKGQIKVPDQKRLKAVARKALRDRQKVPGSKLRNAALSQGVVTLNGVPQRDFPAKGLDEKTVAKAFSAKPPKLGAASKAGAGKRPVTLNGKPLKDFPAKGLDQAATKKAPVTLNGKPLKDFPAKGLDKAPSTLGTTTQTSKAKPRSAPKLSTRGTAAPSTLPKRPAPQKLPAKAGAGASKKPKPQQNATSKTAQTSSTPPKDTGDKPAVTKAPTKKTDNNLTSEPKPNAIPKQPDSKPQLPSAPPTVAGSDASNDKHVESADIRRAKKKLELRQGKQEPKRKIRRALESSAATA